MWGAQAPGPLRGRVASIPPQKGHVGLVKDSAILLFSREARVGSACKLRTALTSQTDRDLGCPRKVAPGLPERSKAAWARVTQYPVTVGLWGITTVSRDCEIQIATL